MKRRTTHYPEPLSPKQQRLIAAILFGAAVCAIAVYHRLLLYSVVGDENEHLYVAQQVASGVSLYGGIHSARPPLMFLPLVALLKLGLAPLLAGRLCVFLAEVGAAGVLWWIGWRLWDLWSGLAAAVLFLFSHDVANIFPFVGIQQTAFLGLLCLALRVRGKAAWSGVVAGLALASGQHSAVIVAVTALYQVTSKPKAFATFVLSALGTLTLIVGVCVAAGGTGIWQDLIGNHLFHFNGGRNEARMQAFTWRLGNWTCANAGILLLALTAAVVGFKDARLRFWSLVTAIHLFAVVAMNSGQIMYIIPATPLLAALAGFGLTHVLGKLKLWSQAQGWRRPSPRSVVVLCLYLLVAGGGLWMTQQIYDEHYLGRYSFWPHLRELELNRRASTKPADRVAAVVAHWMPQGASLFGGPPDLVSYVAMKAGVRIAGQLADLSGEWIYNGMVQRSDVISKIESDQVEFFAASEGDFYLIDRTFQSYLMKCYDDPNEFPPLPGNLMGQLYLFRHKPERPCQ
jgi:hypothetical protein